MCERLAGFVGENSPLRAERNILVGTIHGIAHRMLKLHWTQTKTPQNFQLFDGNS